MVMLRLKGIFDCLYFGFVPSFVYEKESHYKGKCSYWFHLRMNLRFAWHWATFQESKGLRELATQKTTYLR